MSPEADTSDFVDFFIPGEEGPRRVGSVAGMNEAVNALLATSNGTPARLYHRARAALPAGGVDHELQVAVNAGRNVGASRIGANGTWFTKGTVPSEGATTVGVIYDYPEYSEVPLSGVLTALAEFLINHQLPTVVV